MRCMLHYKWHRHPCTAPGTCNGKAVSKNGWLSALTKLTWEGVQVEDREGQLAAHVALLEKVMGLLGINTEQPEALLQELRVLALERAQLSEEDIVQAIADRAAARADKNYARADELREQFAIKGINFQDSPQGTTWRPSTQE